MAVVVAGCAIAPAAAGTLAIGYTITFWALPFGHTDFQAKFADGTYNAKSHFQTSGVISVFWHSKIDATANGHIGAHSVAPEVYDSYAQDHNSKIQRVKVTFANDIPDTFADPPYNTKKYPVSDAQKKNTVDPMTAITGILAGVKADAKNPCGTGVQVFDGKRRYNIGFTYLKDEPLKLENGLFSGTAHLCQVHYVQIAGYKQKIISEGKTLPPMYADFVDVPSVDAPSGRYVVAAKTWAALSLGTVTATLTELKVDGAVPAGFGTVKS